jgi:hypothetical protein
VTEGQQRPRSFSPAAVPIALLKQSLRPGDVLEFDENASFLKATKSISPTAWKHFGTQWTDPWPNQTVDATLDELRSPVELPIHPDKP